MGVGVAGRPADSVLAMSRQPDTPAPPAPRMRLQPPWDAAAAAPPSAPVPAGLTFLHRWRALRLVGRRGVEVEGTPVIGRGVRIEVAPGARLTLGAGCVLHDGCRLHVRGGTLSIGAGAVLGARCALVVHADVSLGDGCRLGDGVVCHDALPVHADPERPTRAQGIRTAPIAIGSKARIGPGVVLEAGATVPPQTAVAAHRVLHAPVAR